MAHPDLAVVTGAFSYTGGYIARRLLDEGVRVRTLTLDPGLQHPLSGRMQAAPVDFSDPDALRQAMRGASVLYNTYWMRFERDRTTFSHAVENSRTLLEAAARGVRGTGCLRRNHGITGCCLCRVCAVAAVDARCALSCSGVRLSPTVRLCEEELSLRLRLR